MHVYGGDTGREASECPYLLGSKEGVNHIRMQIKMCSIEAPAAKPCGLSKL